MEDGTPFIKLTFIIVLVILEALIAAAETAFKNVNESVIRKKAEEGDRKAKAVLKNLENPERYMNVVEVILAVTSMAIGLVYSASMQRAAAHYAEAMGFRGSSESVYIVGGIIFTLLLVFVVILLGNIFPKKLAACYSLKTAYLLVPFINIFRVFLKPLLFLLEVSVRFLLFLCRIKPEQMMENVTEDEIISIVNEGREQGILEENEVEMISNIIELDDKEVRDVMTHFKKVVAISADQSFEDTVRFMLSEGYSRYPLYEGSIDNIIGILNFKDMMKYYVSGKDRSIALRQIARKPYLVPDTQGIDVLFSEFQSKKIHMAVAIDEYGQTAGIVTMEDIIEEIVGNIVDEYDVDEKMIIRQGKDRYLVKGLAKLDEVSEFTGSDLTHEDFETINGLLISLLGHIPEEKERATLSYRDFRFRIVDVRNKMIRYARAYRVPDKE